MDILRVLILSAVEGITEFLPISSTGHLILVNQFVRLQPEAFANAFNYIIQLGAILSVVVVYFHKLNPFSKAKLPIERLPKNYTRWNAQTKLYYRIKHYDRPTMRLWGKVIVGILPAAVIGLALNDFVDAHLSSPFVIALTMFGYGVVILATERWNARRRNVRFATVDDIDWRTALLIGFFQCLAIIPGTSRSAATIIGAMLLGTTRVAAADFSFFLAIPTMAGMTLVKVLKNLGAFSFGQWMLILLGAIASFVVAYVVVRKFLSYVQKHDFRVFGYYRILLGMLILLYFLVF